MKVGGGGGAEVGIDALDGADDAPRVEQSASVAAAPPTPAPRAEWVFSEAGQTPPPRRLTTAWTPRVADTSRWPTEPLRWNGVGVVRDVPELEAFAVQQFPNLAIQGPQANLFFQELVERGAFDPARNLALRALLEPIVRLCPRFPAGLDPMDLRWSQHPGALELLKVAGWAAQPGLPLGARRSPAGTTAIERVAAGLMAWCSAAAAQRFGVLGRVELEDAFGRLGTKLFSSFSDPICDELGLARYPGTDPSEVSEQDFERKLERLQRIGKILEDALAQGSKARAFLEQAARDHPELARELLGGVGVVSPAPATHPGRGLERLIRFGAWPIIPRTSQAPPTFEEVEVTRRTAPAALEKILDATEFREHLPLVDTALELCPSRLLEDAQVVCVQHGLASQWAVFRGLEGKGLRPENTQIISAPYSGSPLVQEKFRRAGYHFETPLGMTPKESLERLEAELEASLMRALERAKPGRPILVLDDGGHASTLLAGKLKAHAHRFRVVEQTTRGLRRVEKLVPINFVCRSIAENPLKKYEASQVALDSFANVDRTLGHIGMSPIEGQPISIIGYGMIGRGLALHGRRHGCAVAIWDKDPAKRAAAVKDGFFAPDDPSVVLRGRYMVFGATGEESIGRAEIEAMDSGTVVASVSSTDVEIADLSRAPGVKAWTVSTQGPGDQRYVNKLWRVQDKDILVLRNRFPVTFNGDIETGAYDGFEQTRAAMVLGIIDAMSAEAPGLAGLSDDLTLQFVLRASERGHGVRLPPEYIEALKQRPGFTVKAHR